MLERMAELEGQLAKWSEPPASEPPDADAISADLEHEGLPSSAWLEEAWGAGASNDHSPTADPAHQVERLWQRIEELERRLEQARAVATHEAPAEEGRAGDAEPESGTATPAESPVTGTQLEPPRRWWRRMLPWR